MTYRFTTQRGELQREKGEGVISSILVKKRNVSYMLKQTPERHRKLPIVLSRPVLPFAFGVLLFLSKRREGGYFLLY